MSDVPALVALDRHEAAERLAAAAEAVLATPATRPSERRVRAELHQAVTDYRETTS